MIIEARNIEKRFGRDEALSGLSFSVAEGSVYALIGANGAGKTTTIKMMMNILTPTRGDLTLMGTPSRELTSCHLSQIGYVSESQVLPGQMTVGAYLNYLRPFYSNWDEALEKAMLRRFKLPMERKIRALSHGMRIKVALVAALAFKPKLLVLDEPFNGLDSLVRDDLIESVLSHAEGLTIFISSHDLNEIEGFVSDVGFLNQGRLLFENSIEVLNARVRSIRVTLQSTVRPPGTWPGAWIDPGTSGNVLSFVHTAFTEDRLASEIAAAFGDVKFVQAEPMDLRSIFTAFARAEQMKGG
ncbi:ABC transporter ATP-binding protein [Caballeronia sp. dw_19]|jgi:ABC-2 type transport system ATP-binding protein|uniref:ABC transporter ATP-binding protein n=1 Tax=unclassified Caballeronia TaxID=2646786 RepID=UPI001BD61CB4|nr:ABC transporter ATP-binding protein [Caballeronia sp. dw_19]